MFSKAGSFLAVFVLAFSVFAQQDVVGPQDNAVLWEPGEIVSRDLYLGPGISLQPQFKGLKYIGRQPGGNSIKYRVMDGNGVEWIAKAADESQPEVAATRLLWAVGYRTEIDHLAPKFVIDKVGSYRNVRLEARPDKIKRGERWSWTSNIARLV